MQIKNTGQLRQFLANAIIGVRDGDIKPEAASRVVKLAEKINESFYAENKTAILNLQLGRTVAKLGELPIAEE